MSEKQTNGALVRIAPHQHSLQELQGYGAVFAKSGYFEDARSEAQAVVKVLYGQELGLTPVVSMMGIHIIQGKPSLSAGTIAAKVRAHPSYDYRVKDHTEEACEVLFLMDGKEIGTSRYTLDDARRAGALDGKNAHTWKKHAKNMLFARAMSNGAKWHCPDIFGGPVYIPEEMGALIDGETGEIIQGDPSTWPTVGRDPEPVEQVPAAEPVPPKSNGTAAKPEPPAAPPDTATAKDFGRRADELGLTEEAKADLQAFVERLVPDYEGRSFKHFTGRDWFVMIEAMHEYATRRDMEKMPQAQEPPAEENDPFAAIPDAYREPAPKAGKKQPAEAF